MVFKEVNVGFGAVDAHTYPSSTQAYPLPQHFAQDRGACSQVQQDGALQTTQRLSYGPR